jgi:multicomponent K+:H+ antiporter subunit G
MILELLISFFILAGAAFALIGSIGLSRFADFYTRLHGPTKATTLGVGGMLLASAIFFSTGPGTSLHEVLVTIFLFMTAPVSAHMLAKTALHLDVFLASAGWPEHERPAPGPTPPAADEKPAAG